MFNSFKRGFTLIELLVVIAIVAILSVVVLNAVHKTKHGIAIGPATAEACGFWSDCSNTSATAASQTEQETVTEQLNRLQTAVPTPHLENSLERTNISARLVLYSNPTKISYIYLVSYGRVMAYYTVKGKITSGTKRLTANQQVIEADWCGSGNCSLIKDAPELDGTYGASSPYVFFWTTDGTYVQWSGDYMLTDQPLQLATPPELIRNVK